MKSKQIERLEEVLKTEGITMEELAEKISELEWHIRWMLVHKDDGHVNSILFRIAHLFEFEKGKKIGSYLMGHSYDYDENGELQPVEDQ